MAAAFTRAGQLALAAGWLLPLQIGAGVALCLLSAEHAKRLLEPGHRQDLRVSRRARKLRRADRGGRSRWSSR